MEAATMPTPTEPVAPRLQPQEISFPLPKALHTTAHIHLTLLDTCATVFLATSTPGDSAGSVRPMGSFIYAMPDVSDYLIEKHSTRFSINILVFSRIYCYTVLVDLPFIYMT